ncbi:hypothetical protein BGZ94_004150, partial [Podila epigama]
MNSNNTVGQMCHGCADSGCFVSDTSDTALATIPQQSDSCDTATPFPTAVIALVDANASCGTSINTNVNANVNASDKDSGNSIAPATAADTSTSTSAGTDTSQRQYCTISIYTVGEHPHHLLRLLKSLDSNNQHKTPINDDYRHTVPDSWVGGSGQLDTATLKMTKPEHSITANRAKTIPNDHLTHSTLASPCCYRCCSPHLSCTPLLFQKKNVPIPAPGPRRSLLSDMLNSQAVPTRLEQNANRRRMLKSMRRYSVDASEMDFNLCSRPSGRATPMQTISSEGESVESSSSSSSSSSRLMLPDGRNGFSSTPTVRYLRNPCHAAIKTKLQPSAYRSAATRRGNDEDGETPDYFDTEDRV